jgi:FlaA1/EpsC-like NDP-sugar epimerase
MQISETKHFFENRRILVTGACGTVGHELVKQLIDQFAVTELICMDNNESGLFFLEQEFRNHDNANFFVGDVRDRDKLLRRMKDVDYVFHAAAFKHVTICERSPFEAVQTNIIGVQNIITAATENGVKRVIFTSSDKAVNPTNVMGTSKLMGERLMTASNTNLHSPGTILASTRFGNVLGSRGSVIPVFRDQIAKGGPVTLTSPEMTRFIMSVHESVRLLIDSMQLACGGEVFITKMPGIRIEDLAAVMVEHLAPVYDYSPKDIEIRKVGVFPGEKMYEELMSLEETRRAWELDRYFVVLPAFSSLYRQTDYNYPGPIGKKVTNPYNSANQPTLTPQELLGFLTENTLL